MEASNYGKYSSAYESLLTGNNLEINNIELTAAEKVVLLLEDGENSRRFDS